MKHDNTLSTIQNNQQLAYNYETEIRDEAQLYEPAEEERSNDIAIKYEELSDEELVKQYLQREDEEAFNEIVDRYGWKIHRLAFGITHDMRDADDVLQDVFLILVEKLDSFREEAQFSTWLYRVAVNTSYMFLKQRKKYSQDISLEDYETYDGNGYLNGIQVQDWSFIPYDNVLRIEQKERIEKAISEMPQINRVVFHLSHLEDRSAAEIGEILGLTIPAVKSRIRRARLFLRNELSEDLYKL